MPGYDHARLGRGVVPDNGMSDTRCAGAHVVLGRVGPVGHVDTKRNSIKRLLNGPNVRQQVMPPNQAQTPRTMVLARRPCERGSPA